MKRFPTPFAFLLPLRPARTDWLFYGTGKIPSLLEPHEQVVVRYAELPRPFAKRLRLPLVFISLRFHGCIYNHKPRRQSRAKPWSQALSTMLYSQSRNPYYDFEESLDSIVSTIFLNSSKIEQSSFAIFKTQS